MIRNWDIIEKLAYLDLLPKYHMFSWLQDWYHRVDIIRSKLRELEESELKFQAELVRHKEHECHKS